MLVRGLPDTPWAVVGVARLVRIYRTSEILLEQVEHGRIVRAGQPDLGIVVNVRNFGFVFSDGLLDADKPVCIDGSCEISIQAFFIFINASTHLYDIL
jgi:hypothetical protein